MWEVLKWFTTVIIFVMGIAIAVLRSKLKSSDDRIKELEIKHQTELIHINKELSSLRMDLAKNYVSNNAFKEFRVEIKSDFDRLYNRLDTYLTEKK